MDNWLLSLAQSSSGWGLPLFVFLTTVISGLLSGLIGFEREIRGQSAGLRTHVLLAVGSSLMMSISIYAIKAAGVTFDASRIGAGVVSGIGFLCAGCIIRTKASIKGLTTSATLWICGGIGLACGAGFVLEAIVATAVALFFLLGLIGLEKVLDHRAPTIRIYTPYDVPVLSEIHQKADQFGLTIKDIDSKDTDLDGEERFVEVTIRFAYKSSSLAIAEFLEAFREDGRGLRVEGPKFEVRKK